MITCAMMEVRTHENPTRNAVTRVRRRPGSLRAIRRAGRLRARHTALVDQTPPAGLPQEGRREPKPARPETKSHAFRFFGPRGRFLREAFPPVLRRIVASELL